MQELPKIAQARLKAKPETPKTAAAPESDARFPGGEHPDANLLVAFAEKSLTEKEHAQVLNHLNQCADCRGVAAFVLPEKPAELVPARVAAPRSWYSWPVLRWGALAAVLGTLTMVVVLHPGMWNRPAEVSQRTAPPPVPTGSLSSPQSAPVPQPSAAANSVAPKAKTVSPAPESAEVMNAMQKTARADKDLALNASLARKEAARQVSVMASSQPPATLRAENVAGGHVAREESKAADTLSAVVVSTPPPPPASVPNAMQPSKGAATESAPAPRAMSPVPQTNQNVAVTVAAPAVVPPAGPPPSAAPATLARVQASASMESMKAFRTATAVGGGSLGTIWSVSSEGKLQRTSDGGKSVESIHVADGVKFKAVAALGSIVWAGGAGGNLFHSADGGATWVQVGIPFEGSTVTEAIVRIQLLTPRRLTVTTDSGSQWFTDDGGQRWQKL
jgi:hypothetical protein